MAILTQPEPSGFELGPLAPNGTYVATSLEIQDEFGVERPKFENPQESEKLDVTRFLFGFKGPDGKLYKVQSFEFRISGSTKSNLFKFLTSWLGQAPKYGWDYCELKGHGAMITVSHKLSRDGTKTYANIVGISPVIDQLKDQVLPIEAFAQPQPPAQGTPLTDPNMGINQPTTNPLPPSPPQPWEPAADSQDDQPY